MAAGGSHDMEAIEKKTAVIFCFYGRVVFVSSKLIYWRSLSETLRFRGHPLTAEEKLEVVRLIGADGMVSVRLGSDSSQWLCSLRSRFIYTLI